MTHIYYTHTHNHNVGSLMSLNYLIPYHELCVKVHVLDEGITAFMHDEVSMDEDGRDHIIHTVKSVVTTMDDDNARDDDVVVASPPLSNSYSNPVISGETRRGGDEL